MYYLQKSFYCHITCFDTCIFVDIKDHHLSRIYLYGLTLIEKVLVKSMKIEIRKCRK